MKKLIAIAAISTIAVGAFADDGAEAPKEAAAAPVAAEAEKPHTPPAFDRAKYEERMKQRSLERKAKVVEILAKAGVPAEKAEATADEIDGVYTRRPPRRPAPHGMRPPRQRPPRRPDAKATPPAEAAAPAAK